MTMVLLRIGGLNIYLQTLLGLLFFVVALFIFWRELKTTSFNEEKFFDNFFLSLVVAYIIARVVYVLSLPQYFINHFTRAILFYVYPGSNFVAFWLVFYLMWFLFARREKIESYQISKLITTPSLIFISSAFFLNTVFKFNYYYLVQTVCFAVFLLIYQLWLLPKTIEQKVSVNSYFLVLQLFFLVSQFSAGFFIKHQLYLKSKFSFLSWEQLFLLTFCLISIVLALLKQKKKTAPLSVK